ncbi:alpha/beta fold hydrolase [Dinoroseobacter sp. S76]|uniref:alpha/beta fold hydrolase n=1 Tax=Dinoroseobacter sp. S76 TaxID=3415124 RepID=UPI003C7D3F31
MSISTQTRLARTDARTEDCDDNRPAPSVETPTLPPVFAIHGTASSGRQWQSLAAHLGASRTLIAPDLPGYGATPSQLDRLSYLEAMLWQSPGPMDLVAHSFGGAVALMLANRNPDRVRSLTLFDPVMPVLPGRGAASVAPDLRVLWTQVRGQPAPVMMARFLDFWCAPGTWIGLPRHRQDALLTQSAALTRDFEEICAGYWTVAHPAYFGPVTVLRGGRSPQVTVDVSAKILADYPQARCTVLPGLGHMAPLTHADQVNPHFAAALAEAAPQRGTACGLLSAA